MYNLKKFSNGLRLLTIPVTGAKTITILVLVPLGSRYETKTANGISHFIEHMMFKGTKRRPNNFMIASELDGIGAEYNAFTSKDHTGYWIKTTPDNINLALDILSDMLFNSTFNKDDFQKERGVILEEIKMYEDNPLLYIEDFFERSLYGNHPLGWMISGPISGVKKLKREELFKYRKKFYQPNNILVGIAGNIKKNQTIELVKKYFSHSPRKKNGNKYLPFKKKVSKPKANVLFRKTKQVQIALGVPAYSYFNKQLEALEVLSVILGGNMSSRLFREVRVKRGLCYFVRTDMSVYQDTGSFIVRAGLNKDRIYEAIKVILFEINKIREQGVTDQELKRAKDYIKGHFLLSLEDSAALNSWYTKQLLLIGKILTPEKKLIKINKVSKNDIQKVSHNILQNNRLILSLIGPFKSSQPFLQILKDNV